MSAARDVESVVTEESLASQVGFLSDSICTGRATGTRGSQEAIFWLCSQMKNAGLLPMDGSYTHSFMTSGKIGRNVMGLLLGSNSYSDDRYIIVASHFDNLGEMNGVVYPGADSNASGVAAMLSIAKMFQAARLDGRRYGRNIIFVALDAKQLSMAGSQALWNDIQRGKLHNPLTGRAITKEKIDMFVNLDILGGVEAPLHKGRPDYLIMLGGGKHTNHLSTVNVAYGLGFDLSFNYYGSQGFTDMFLKKVSDQKVFLENGIYSVFFTSGITMQTNKATDTADQLDYTILRKRTWLIWLWIDRVLRQVYY